MELISHRKLVEEARNLVGAAWRHQGRTITGVDCIGMPLLAMSNAGMDPANRLGFLDPTGYSREPSELLLQQTELYCERIDKPIDGALMLFQFPNDNWPRHFAIYSADNGTIIHAHAKIGKVVEHGYRMQWTKWLHSIWKLPGVNYDE